MVYSSGMRATTVKLDGAILKELRAFKRPDQNLSALVRELLRAQIHRSKMARAAEEYAVFLRENRGESMELLFAARNENDSGRCHLGGSHRRHSS
jgi:hypothetical protein